MNFLANLQSLALTLLVVGAAILAVEFTSKTERPKWVLWPIGAAFVAFILGFIPAVKSAGFDAATPLALAVGLIISIATQIFSPRLRAFGAASLGTGSLLLITQAQVPATPFAVWMAMAAGLAFGEILCNSETSLSALLVIAAGCCQAASVTQLGGIHPAPGALLVLCAGIPLLLTAESGKAKPVLQLVAAGLVAALLYVGSNQILKFPAIGIAGAIGVIAMLATIWATPVLPSKAWSFGSALLWLTAGVIAMSDGKSIGLGAVIVAGLAVASIFGKTKSAIAILPVTAMLILRGVANSFPEVTRALDLSQHYAVVGLLLGVLAVVAASQLKQIRAEAGIVATLGASVATAMSPILLGAKGIPGLLLGLCIAPLFVEMDEHSSVNVSLTIGSAILFTVSVLSDKLDITRAEKLGMLTGSLIFLAIMVVVCFLLVRQKPAAQSAVNPE